MTKKILIVGFLIVLTTVTGFAAGQKQTEGSFKGKQITITGTSGQVKGPLSQVIGPWVERTGATVIYNEIPFLELKDKVIMSLTSGVYIGDVLNLPSDMAGDLMGGGYILPVPKKAKDKLNWEDILPPFREQQLDWAGVTYGWPYDGDLLNLYYRKDILENKDNKAKFKSKYGYELSVPKTWDQYEDIAQFFTGWDWDGDGKNEYGCVELPMRNNQLWNGFSSRAVGYAKHPNNPAFYFDPDTMDPLINNPGFVKALEDWIRVLHNYAPPGVLSFGWMENVQSFIGGESALDIQWGDPGPMSLDSSMSVIAHKVGFDLLPGYKEVYNYKTKQWEKVDGINQPAYLGFGGWINMVPKTAKNPEVAYDFLIFISQPDVLKKLNRIPAGANPSRKSSLEDVAFWMQAGFTKEEAIEYLGAIKNSLELKNYVFQLRIPGFTEYQRILEMHVSRALAGETTAQEALNTVAEEWRKVNESLGVQKQKEFYRMSLNLPK